MAQLVEENKGLILMQDCHIRQIQELKQQVQLKDEEIKEFNLINSHKDTTTNELIAAQEKARDIGDERDGYISELS